MLAVTDTGTRHDGRSHAARIFEPFFTTKPQGQGHRSRARHRLRHRAAERRASIWVYSELGKGTTFKILFPAAPEGARAEATALLARPHTQGVERILLVEDEQAVRKFVRTMLEKQGYTVIEALDTDEALRLAADKSVAFDLMLTDVIMPRLNGPELAAQVTQLRPDLQILYMSGYTDRAIRLQDRLGGEAHFIQKPFTPAALGQKLRQLLITK